MSEITTETTAPVELEVGFAGKSIPRKEDGRLVKGEGVYGTLRPDEVVELTDPFFELTIEPANRIRDYALAVGKVRHVGEPVVAVVAATRELARDAADLVEIEYEPLPALVDARLALNDGAPIVHDDAGSNVVWSGTFDW